MVSSVSGIVLLSGISPPEWIVEMDQIWVNLAMRLKAGCPDLRIDSRFACLDSLTGGRSRS
jgi:hypothetical protein